MKTPPFYKWLGLMLLAGLLPLAGCGQPGSWILGTWSFDATYTEKKLKAEAKAAEAKQKEGDSDFVRQLQQAGQGLVGGFATEAMKDSQVQITEKEIITTIGGQGKARPYKVLAETSNEVKVQYLDDNSVLTLRLVDGHLAVPLTSMGTTTWLYYKRK